MRSLFFIVFIVGFSLAAMAIGCGSSDSGGAAAAGAAAGGAATGGAAAGGTSGSGGSAAGSPGAAGSSVGGSSVGGSSAGGSNMSSVACVTYCACHDMNCATTAIPAGLSCAEFCAGMTSDQLGCRQNMCGLVPAQPDNDHCKHSVGIDQCL